VFYFFTALSELDYVFSLPKDVPLGTASAPMPNPALHGLRLSCKGLSFAYPGLPPEFEQFDLEVAPGEKVGIFSATGAGKTALVRVLVGLYTPTSGVIRYNGVDLRDLDPSLLNLHRGLVLDSQWSLFEGTLEENIVMNRPSVSYDDIRWALRFVEMEEEVDALPHGLKTPVRSSAKAWTMAHIQKILVARAIVTHPHLLIMAGTLHSLQPTARETILRRLCAKEEPWSVLLISNDPGAAAYVSRRVTLD
jgi:ABC-type bacteriocin/lantibiotic exporter with double-glycine peptidase domain